MDSWLRPYNCGQIANCQSPLSRAAAMSSNSPVHFPTTAWTTVRAAQNRDGAECLDAMNRCIAAYWKPVFCFLRAKGYPLHQAEDLTQEFFLRFFERDWIRRADQQRGRFRTFLLKIVTHFLADQASSVPAAEIVRRTSRNDFRPGGRFGADVRSAAAPDTGRDLHAAVGLGRAGARPAVPGELVFLRGRPDWYRMFCAVYFPSPGSPRITQQALADQLHVTRDQVRYGLEEVHRQFVQFLRAEMADQIGSHDDLDTEIRELQALLAT